MSKWDRIREFYAEHQDAILSVPANEWAIQPNSWDGVIHYTPIELCLWEDIRNANAVMYPQWPVGRFFVDFGNPVAKVAFECDGAEFHKDKAKDQARDNELKALGWDVFRITGSECITDYDEQSGQPGYARVFVEAFCTKYGLKRKGSRYLPQLRHPGWVEFVGELPEKVPS